jgi:hypothetical protein
MKMMKHLAEMKAFEIVNNMIQHVNMDWKPARQRVAVVPRKN